MLQVVDILIQRRDFLSLGILHFNSKKIRKYIDRTDKIQVLSQGNSNLKTFNSCYLTFLNDIFKKRGEKLIFHVYRFIKDPELMMFYLNKLNKKLEYLHVNIEKIADIVEHSSQFIGCEYFIGTYRGFYLALNNYFDGEMDNIDDYLLKKFANESRLDVLKIFYGKKYDSSVLKEIKSENTGLLEKILPTVDSYDLKLICSNNPKLLSEIEKLSNKDIKSLELTLTIELVKVYIIENKLNKLSRYRISPWTIYCCHMYGLCKMKLDVESYFPCISIKCVESDLLNKFFYCAFRTNNIVIIKSIYYNLMTTIDDNLTEYYNIITGEVDIEDTSNSRTIFLSVVFEDIKLVKSLLEKGHTLTDAEYPSNVCYRYAKGEITYLEALKLKNQSRRQSRKIWKQRLIERLTK